MTVIQKPRRSRGLKSISAAAVAGASVVGLVLGTGTASAAVDSSNTVVDASGNAITVSLEDTFVQGVAPLDGNPLSREWFGNGRITYSVTGPSADDFEGTVKVGYQVGYPASLGGSLSIEWATPTVGIDLASNQTTASPVTAEVQLLPVATAAVEIAPGPGIVQSESSLAVINDSADITGTEGDAAGASGSLQLANVHGTATGILGNVRIRPYAALVSATGDTVVTYGKPVVLN